MRYPEFLKENNTIGVVAPSFGVTGFPYEDRFASSCEKWQKDGYKLKLCPSIYGLNKCASAPAETRAKEFMDMYLDEQVDFVFSVAGGELMCQLLPYVDFERIKESKPKFFAGYSDNTCLSFLLPVLTDTAAFYSYCFGEFGMRDRHVSQKEAIEVFSGKRNRQESYDYYDRSEERDPDPLAGYRPTEKIEIKSLSGKDEEFTGRIIGGCLDVLSVLCGTVDISQFQEKYREDGFIWFMEACDINVLSISRAIWQLKNAGWFKYCRGFVFGRSVHSEEIMDYTFEDAISQLKEFNVPVIYNCDIGHLPPSWTIIEGAMATISKHNDTCTIEYEMK